ncbi:DUF2207 family protein [Microbacterium sp. gxy059]|uniref:DUF2207 family protein n=1 Tax=Microbacterium sp. gxy059 TaxID=2957199 RepID=UPI003D951C05
MRTPGIRLLAGVAIGAAGVLALAAPASADVDDFAFDSHHVDYALSRGDDGIARVDVVETYVAEFPEHDQNRGMVMALPERYEGQPLFVDVVSVTDETGSPRPFDEDRDDGNVHLALGDPDGPYLHGAQTYVVHYTMENVVDVDDADVDEFYWDVLNDRRAQPVREASATVTLEGDLADALLPDRVACYSGALGESEPCDIAVGSGGARIDASVPGGLEPGEGWTIAVGFSPGSFASYDRSLLSSPVGWATIVAGLGSVGALAWALAARRRGLADEPGRPSVVAQFDPPPGVSLHTAGVLAKKGTDPALVGEILRLAVNGALRIVATEEGEGKKAKTTTEVELVDPSRADETGSRLLAAMFPGGAPAGTRFPLGTHDKALAAVGAELAKEAAGDVGKRFHRPVVPGTRAWPIVAAAVTGLAAFVLSVVAAGPLQLFEGAALPIGIAGLVLLFVSILVLARSPLNAAGAQTRDDLLGLREFIRWAEADRIRLLQSPETAQRIAIASDDPAQVLHLYERLLPYAALFGQAKEWAEQIARYAPEAGPAWYDGTTIGFTAAAFSSAVQQTVADTTTSGASSSSGGSSGSGSSGGGGGGASVGGM